MGVVYAIILYSAAQILSTVFGSLADIHSASGSFGIKVTSGIWRVLEIICTIGALGGFAWFFLNLTKFIDLQANATDTATVSRIRLGYIISIAGVVLGLIPSLGWILALICSVLSIVVLITAYDEYGKSTAIGANARRGANYLKYSIIISLIGVLLSHIPLVGWILSLICGIIAIILLFMGWTGIANGAPETK